MRTIKHSLFQRLVAQATEADRQGLTKIADGLTEQVCTHGKADDSGASIGIRTDDAFYSYASDELEKDLNNHLWATIVRIADFYDIKYFDAEKVQETLDKVAENLVREMCESACINHGVGAYEPAVPGQRLEQVAIEVEDE